MFLLDSLMISGIRWTLETVVTAAEAEMNDDSALREQLLEAEMRREMGELSDAEFARIEADLLARIRAIKEQREGGSGPLALGGAQPLETSPDTRFEIEASVSGDFHDPADAPHTTIVDHPPAARGVVGVEEEQSVRVMDMEPGDAAPADHPGLPLTPAARRVRRALPARRRVPAGGRRSRGARRRLPT
jgi:hypothetical protein